MSAPGAAARAESARALARILDGASLRAVLATLADGGDSRDRALVEACVYAACREVFRYQALLRRLLAKPLPRGDREIHALLLVGLAQLDALGVSPHAAVDACVGAARVVGRARHAGLINAVLRRFQRERDALLAAIADDEEARLGHPRWWIDAVRAAWPDDADAVFAAAAAQPPLWLRVNPRRVDPDDYAARLLAAGHAVARDPHLRCALRLDAAPPPTRLPSWAEGLCSVQDMAAQRCVPALDLRPGQRVLDACAAPGGKAAAILEAVDRIDLLALDADAARLARVGPALDRLGLAATLRCADAGAPSTWWDGQPFDRILLDAPCSATGILRRQPDIRWHRRAADIAPLVALQARLLDALWPLLAPGGRLVYATCSILPDENARQIDAFLTRHRDARAVPLDAALFGRDVGGGAQRLPGEGGADGFFHAALVRA